MDSCLMNVDVKRGYNEIFDVIFDTGCVIAGGYARWMLSPSVNPVEAGDIDVWAPNEAAHIAVRKELFNYLEGVVDAGEFTLGKHKVQVIPMETWCDPNFERLIDEYDYTICQAMVNNKYLGVCSTGFHAAEQLKVLELTKWAKENPMRNPIRVLWRGYKYTKRGYYMPMHTLLPIIQKLPTDMTELLDRYTDEPWEYPFL